MVLEERFVVDVTAGRAWNFLFDTNSLAECIPGCINLKSKEKNSYIACMNAKVGPITTNFEIWINITRSHPPNFFGSTIKGYDSLMASEIHANNFVALKELESTKTEIYFHSKVNLIGRLLKFGDSIINCKAKNMAEQFAQSIRAKLKNQNISSKLTY